MKKDIKQFTVEGLNWTHAVTVDTSIFETDRDQYIEAGSRGIEEQLTILKEDKLNLGPVIIVKKGKSKKEALVNTFICLNNVSQFELAQLLRKNFMAQSNGQDLAFDEIGFSFNE